LPNASENSGVLPPLLTTANHDRDAAGLRYLYPVLSRRAGGLSIGINLNPNNACNWRCLYCQVPGLTRGSAPPIDLELLAAELTQMLIDVLQGDFLARRLPEGQRVLRDIAISGNGEPTSCHEFAEVIELIGRAMQRFDLIGRIKLRLISNGSLLHRPEVVRGLTHLAELNGELWIKVDAASEAEIERINGVKLSPAQIEVQVRRAAHIAPTWIQSCFFASDGAEPNPAAVEAWLELLARLCTDNVPLCGVQLYSIARQPMQPQGHRLEPLSAEWFQQLRRRVSALGLPVQLSL